jgi:hypothetical protein
MKDHGRPAVSAPLQTKAAVAVSKVSMIPTGIEATLSPRSATAFARNGLTTDELYDERRNLRREWIQFIDSVDSEEGQKDEIQPRDPKNTINQFAMGDVELCYPTVTNTNTCHLDGIFSVYNDYDAFVEDREGASEDESDDDLHVFQSIKEQMETLDGILEEFSDLANSRSSGSSKEALVVSSKLKSKSNSPKTEMGSEVSDSNNRHMDDDAGTVERYAYLLEKTHMQEDIQEGLYNDCDTFEDEWEALNKLEMDLRQELESVSIEMENKSYRGERSSAMVGRSRKQGNVMERGAAEVGEGEEFQQGQPTKRINKISDGFDAFGNHRIQLARVSQNTAAAFSHVRLTRDLAVLDGKDNEEETSASTGPPPREAPSASAMILDCVFNTELSCTPRACSSFIKEDKDDWDAIAYRARYQESVMLPPEPFLPDRVANMSSISDTSCDGIEPPSSRRELHSTRTVYRFNASELKQHTKEAGDEEKYLGNLGRVAKDSGTTRKMEGDHIVLSPFVKIDVSHDANTVTPAPPPPPAPISYTIRVPAFSSTAAPVTTPSRTKGQNNNTSKEHFEASVEDSERQTGNHSVSNICTAIPKPVSHVAASESESCTSPASLVPTSKRLPFFSPNLSFELDAMSDDSLDLMTISVDDSLNTPKESEESQYELNLQKRPVENPRDVNELEIMKLETYGGHVSPLTSPVSTEDFNKEADTGDECENSIDYVVGRVYARIQVGGVLVLDENLQSSLARIATRAIKDDPIHFKNSLIKGEEEEDNQDEETYNVIETVLAEDSFMNICCRPTVSSLSDRVKIIAGVEDIELARIGEVTGEDISERIGQNNDDDTEYIDTKPKCLETTDIIQPKQVHKESEDYLQIKLLSLNQRLLESIVCGDFGVFSDLTTEEISGIDVRGEINHGRASHWKASLKLKVPTEDESEDRHEYPLAPYRINMEGSSVEQLSPGVAVVIYTLIERKNDISVMVYRETRIWKKTCDDGHWKNCHFHRSPVNPSTKEEPWMDGSTHFVT